ncbi:DUF5957 family protein [Thalassobacillus pellis]|uniref:DUF5957 family protein n=1 Tax=Thalassobacillus pellis TaxID=748008 RepID=UPI00196199E1|nr:DUF5957 family protein [Thalassobacillus pellis]MBM7554228.1 hypothetical protein [Thalassobacillus pellis]
MRIILSILGGFIGGFILGIALSSVFGVIGMVLFNEPMGMKFLSYYTAVIVAVLVPVIDQKSVKKQSY